MTPADLPAVEKLVSGLEGAETVVRDVKRYVDARRDPIEDGATPIYAAVAVCMEQIVGMAVLRQEKVRFSVVTIIVPSHTCVCVCVGDRILATSGLTITLKTLSISTTNVRRNMATSTTLYSTQSLLRTPNTSSR